MTTESARRQTIIYRCNQSIKLKSINKAINPSIHQSINQSMESHSGDTTFTVVKELRSKMFGQHPRYFKAVFLKQRRIIIVSIYKYTVYIMF
jgi:hypothetical protein